MEITIQSTLLVELGALMLTVMFYIIVDAMMYLELRRNWRPKHDKIAIISSAIIGHFTVYMPMYMIHYMDYGTR